jgi:Transposase DDE domain
VIDLVLSLQALHLDAGWVREIVVKTETGETLRLMTNDLDAPAQEIADLYKRRWRIELFFRLMKQTPRITNRRFIRGPRARSAVRIPPHPRFQIGAGPLKKPC